MHKFNIAIIPKGQAHDKLIELSEAMCRSKKTTYKLGKDSIPHMTIAQFVTSEENALNIWEKVKTLSLNSPIVTQGFYITSPIPDGRCYAGMRTANNAEIQNCHISMLKQIPANIVNGGVGDSYFPHFTTALLKQKDFAGLDIEIFTNNLVIEKYYLALGLSGEDWQFKEVLKK